MADEPGLIADIYDAALDPSGWDWVVKRIVAATGSLSGALIIHEADAAHFKALCNIDPFWADAYATTYCKINPLAVAAARIAPGEISAGSSQTQTDRFKASRFYNEFARPQGWADVIRIGLLCTPEAAGRMVLHRAPEAIAPDAGQWGLLETLAPHLKRAAAVQDALSRAEAATGSLGAAGAAAGIAVFLLAKDCRVLYANAKAEDILRRRIGLCFEKGRLTAATPALSARLKALTREGAKPGRAEAGAAGTLELNRGEQCLPGLAHVFPLAAMRAHSIFGIDQPAVAVVVVDSGAQLKVRVQAFAGRYGLTPAETRVVEEIITGSGLPAAAVQLGIAYPTVRTHLQHIFAKTRTNHQAELIRQFFEATLPS